MRIVKPSRDLRSRDRDAGCYHGSFPDKMHRVEEKEEKGKEHSQAQASGCSRMGRWDNQLSPVYYDQDWTEFCINAWATGIRMSWAGTKFSIPPLIPAAVLPLCPTELPTTGISPAQTYTTLSSMPLA